MRIIDYLFVATAIIFLACQGIKGGTEMTKCPISGCEGTKTWLEGAPKEWWCSLGHKWDKMGVLDILSVDKGEGGTTRFEENPASLYVPAEELEELRRKAKLWDGYHKLLDRIHVELNPSPISSIGGLTVMSELKDKAARWDELMAPRSDSPPKDMAGIEYPRGHILREEWERAPINQKAAQWDRFNDVFETLPEIEAAAKNWKDAGWRAQVHLVREHIEWVGAKPLKVAEYEHLARAFVRIARKPNPEQPEGLGIPLWIAVAIAQQESNFDNSAVGKQGEKTLMQILPLKGRKKAIEDGLADSAFAIDWAMRNCFYPGYVLAINASRASVEKAIASALKRYNGGSKYADEVMALGAKMVKADALWKLVPE